MPSELIALQVYSSSSSTCKLLIISTCFAPLSKIVHFNVLDNSLLPQNQATSGLGVPVISHSKEIEPPCDACCVLND